jgi:ubiquinone/menaquinone biosynthesis C-methylase UbiE
VNQCAGPFGAAYDWWIERPSVAQLIGRAVWGVDLELLYRSIAGEIGALADGTVVYDVPCGGGLALRALRPDQDVRFVAADVDPKMLDRTRNRSVARGLMQVEIVEADMLDLPFGDASADVVLTYSGLHMVASPQRAVAELVRCLKPGGRIAGTSFLTGGTRRQHALFALGKRVGEAGLPGTAQDLRHWLQRVGIENIQIDGNGFAAFSGTRAVGS